MNKPQQAAYHSIFVGVKNLSDEIQVPHFPGIAFFPSGTVFFSRFSSRMSILIYTLFHISDFRLSYHVVLLITTINLLTSSVPQ